MNNVNIKPIKSYFNPYINKLTIFNENTNKSGIYCWSNLVTNRCYVGSAINLSKRFRDYLSYKYINKEMLRSNSIIIKALSKYDYYNFTLNILEYCDTTSLIQREQYYIDTLKLEYNICLKANSRLGVKYRPETLLKFKNRKLSDQALAN